ncbi:hypothetical protein VCHENC02_1696A, partial [Vibrio harveyi]
MISFFRFIGL